MAERPKRTCAFVAALVAAAVVGLTAPAGAQGVRDPIALPKVRPAHDAAPVAPARAERRSFFDNLFGTGDRPGSQQQSSTPPPAFAASANSRFTGEQQRALHEISGYFNSFDKMEGEFIQFGPDGSQAEGVFFLDKPGQIRFHYRPPVRLDIIADGSTVAIKNTTAETQDMYPLSQTPLRHLLSEDIDLTSDDLVTSIREEPDLISLVIEEQSRLVDGSLTMIFDRETFELRQWVVTDAQGLNTSVAIFNTATGRDQERGIYRIDPSPFD